MARYRSGTITTPDIDILDILGADLTQRNEKDYLLTISGGGGGEGGGSVAVTEISSSVPGDTHTLGVTSQLVLADASLGTLNLDLPSAVGLAGVAYKVRKVADLNLAHLVNVVPVGTQTIDGVTGPRVLSALYDSIGIMSDGANWQRIDSAAGTGITTVTSTGGTVAITNPNGPSVNIEVSSSSTPLSVVGPKTANYTVAGSDDVVLVSNASSTVHITLPTAVGATRKRLTILKVNPVNGAFLCDILTTSGQTISGQAKVNLNAQGETLTVVSDGTNWQRIDGNQSVWGISNDWFVGGVGASGNGRSPSTAFVTFAEAQALAQGGDTIHLCGDITEQCVLSVDMDGHGYRIMPPANGSDCLHMVGTGQTVRNVQTFNNLPGFVGNGLHLEGCNFARIYNWTHSNQFVATKTTGGNGLFAAHGEGNAFYSPYVNGATVGYNLAEEFSVNSFFSLTAVQCYQSIYWNGQYTTGTAATAGCGGCTFVRAKCTSNITLAGGDYGVLMENKTVGGDPSGHIFFFPDFTEGQGSTHIQDRCRENAFHRLSVAGTMTVDSDANVFTAPKGNALIINGNNNSVSNSALGTGLHVNGTQNRIGRDSGYGTNDARSWTSVGPGNFTEQPKGFNVPGSGVIGASFFDVTIADMFRFTATDATARTMDEPRLFDTTGAVILEGWEITIIIQNSSGGAMGATTWPAIYVLTGGAWANPASTKSKLVRFKSDGTNWIETTRSADY